MSDAEDFELSALLENSEDKEYKSEKSKSQGVQNNIKLSYAVGATTTLIFLLDIIAFAVVIRILLDARYLDKPDNLEFRNPYIGLDELYSSRKVKSSFYPKLANEPRFSAQLSSAEPNKVFPIDLHRWLSDFGFLSPPDRRLKVSSTVHTIVQFHVLDYGMERCALAVRLPKRGEVLPNLYSLPEPDDVVQLDICELSAKRPLKEGEISWATRPHCVRKLQILEARVGEEVELDHFPCKSGTILAYQISCRGSELSCNIDVWSNQNATWGFYINQYQTL